MSKLVRARVKRFEDRPKWAKCCSRSIELDDEIGDLTVDLDDVQISPVCPCRFCYAPMPEWKAVAVKSGRYNDGGMYPLDLLDLDEGPLEAAQAGAGS